MVTKFFTHKTFRQAEATRKSGGDSKCTLSAVQVVDSAAELACRGRKEPTGKCSLLEVTATEGHGGKYGDLGSAKLALEKSVNIKVKISEGK